MMNKERLAMGLFFLLGLSTLVFGALVMYQTYDLDHLEGRTTLMGGVVDNNDIPLEGVIINCSDRETTSLSDGTWVLHGVPQGFVTVHFYKPGFVRYSIKWLAYPEEELDDIEKSPNNLSYSFKEAGASDIQLSREMEDWKVDIYQNGTLTLRISETFLETAGITEFFYSNDVNSLKRESVTSDNISVQVETDGKFKVGLSRTGPFLMGFHPVGNEIDISEGLQELLDSGSNLSHVPDHGTIMFEIKDSIIQDKISLVLLDNLTGKEISTMEISSQGPSEIPVSPGVYDLEMTGREIRDRRFSALIVNESETKNIETILIDADVEEELDLSLRGNYFIAAAYLGISLVLFYAALYIRKGGSWAVLLILAFVGFISQGFQLYIFNINSLIAVVLMVVLFSIRSEYNRKRQRMLDSRGSRKM